MTCRPLGGAHTRVSVLGLGTWMTVGDVVNDHGAASRIFHAAFDAGVTLFDTADSYAGGAGERLMGSCLAGLPRERLILSTKTFFAVGDDASNRGLSRARIAAAVEQSLRNLRTDYLDLYFCHRPDPATPLDETVRAMSDLVRQGKVRHWGTSEWSATRIRKAWQIAATAGRPGPEVEQPEYSLVARARFEIEIAPALRRHQMGAITWSPLASGLLTGKYDRGLPADSRLARTGWLRQQMLTAANLAGTRGMTAIADSLGCTRAQLAIAYAASHPAVSSVITGATSLEQLRENLGALSVTITPDVRARLERLFPRPLASFAKKWVRQLEAIR
jgi:voltage-dependent potassium channel beta subunit